MREDSVIEQHLRAGHDRRARLDAAVAAFRRLAPADHGHFLATIEADLGGAPFDTLIAGLEPAPPRLLSAGPVVVEARPVEARPVEARAGSIRESVLGVLADGSSRTTAEIRGVLELHRPINRASLHTEIFTMRKLGLLRSEGRGKGTRHALAALPVAEAPPASAGGARERAPRPPRRKRDDDEDRPAPDRDRAVAPDAAKLYAVAISGHHLLTKQEELALARLLEDVEVQLWEQLLAGPLEIEARDRFRAYDPPVDPPHALAARTADLDRLITAHVLAPRDATRPDALASVRAALRPLAAEADRIRTRFATCNLRFVPAIIRRYGYHVGTSLSMADLIQEGNLGVIRAIPRFDYRRGLRFSTFASWWIRHYLVRARQNLGAEVRIPVHLQELMSKARRGTRELERTLGREPTSAELAAHLKVSKVSLRALDRDWPRFREALPVANSVGEEGELPMHLASDAPLADEVLVRSQADAQVVAAIEQLPPLLATIVRRRFGFTAGAPETLLQIGESMDLSRERIRQLEHRALGLLRGIVDAANVGA